ncbi:MAG: DUF1015 domain-containing protein [Propionibacteriaceae bacterium]|nr:DUF1015 domain-containing protein [Propionibacteriaceae bacterium]
MPVFRPFQAFRFSPDADLNQTIAPPYDVLSDADVAELAARDPHNIVHIDVPQGDEQRYERAAEALSDWLAEGVLVQDPVPSFTIYRMAFTDAAGANREIVGVLGGLEVVDEGAGGVLPHERTTPKAKTDRLDLTRATHANLSPVWGLSLARGLTDALREPGEPMGSMEAEGVVHTVERVTDPERVARIEEILAADDVLIADGHHRYAISRTYRDEVRAATGRTDTDAELTLTFVNELIPEQLSIEAIHRLYTGTTVEQLRAKLSESFYIEPAPELTRHLLGDMVELGRLLLLFVENGEPGAEWLIPKPEVFEGVRALDGAYLEHALAGFPHEVQYQHGLQETGERVLAGDVAAAILIRPTSLGEIERTAREGLLMPPKSTFFTPKLRTGFVVRPTA